MIRAFLAIGLAACCLPVQTVGAAAENRTEHSIAGPLGVLQKADARLQTLGWRLTTANAPYCSERRPAIGLLVQDVMDYDTPEAVRAAIGIRGDIAVQTVAEESPADKANLAPNQQIVAIDGHAMAALPRARTDDHTRLPAVQALIDTALARDGKVSIAIAGRDAPVEITGVLTCASTFALLIASRSAQADGHRVLIGQDFTSSRNPADTLDDGELAAAIAHELAHVVLGHRVWLDRIGHDPGNIRITEREADRLSVWLLANAGFDPTAAPRLLRGWGRRNDPGFLPNPTHEAWEDRAALAEVEIQRLRHAMKMRGAADWSQDFARE